MKELEKEELNKIIELLERSNSKKDAYLAIYQYGFGPDESFAKANKDGLELFAAQLLKASLETDKILSDKDKNIIPLNYNEEWIEGEIFIQYIESTDKKGYEARKEVYKESFFAKLIPVGCFGVFIFIVIAAIVGAISIFSWLF
ncbi:MAG: hypothetical protein ACWA41_05640 [Putridiphycobacter sp.]